MSTLKKLTDFLDRKRNLINSVFLCALSVFGALNIFFWNIPIIDKVSISGGAALLILLFMFNINVFKTWQVCLVMINLTALSATLILHQGSGLGVVLMALYLIMSLIIYNAITFDKKAITISRGLVIVALIGLFALSKYRRAQDGTWIFIFDRFKGAPINNNSICILIAAFIFLAVILLKKFYESKSKLWLAVIALIVAAGMAAAYPFGGRISIASIAVFLLLVLLRPLKINMRVYSVLCVAMFIAALLLPVLYIYLYDTIGDFTFMGKNFFSGRQNVWRSAFDQIFEYPLFGSGTVFSMDSAGNTSTQSAHNTMLGLWKNVGIIPMVSVVLCFFERRYKYAKIEDRAILALLVIMFTESFFMDSHFCFIFLVFMLRSHDDIEDLPPATIVTWFKNKFSLKRKETTEAK